MEHDVRREAKHQTRSAGLLRKSVAQLAVLGLVAGGALMALTSSVSATEESCVDSAQEGHTLILCKSGPETAVAGTVIHYTLTPTIDGDHDDSFAVNDTLPTGAFLAGLPTGDNWDCTGSTVTAVACVPISGFDPKDADTLGAIDVPVFISSAYVGDVPPLCNTATLTRTENEQDLSVAEEDDENSKTVESNEVCTTVTRVTDLSIVKTGPTSATAPGTVTYTITVKNEGPSNGLPITFTDTLPYGAATPFKSFSSTDSSMACSSDGTTLTCTADALAAGASTSVDVVLGIDATLANKTLTNCADITEGDNSGNTANDSSCTSLDPTVNGGLIQVEAATAVKTAPAFTG